MGLIGFLNEVRNSGKKIGRKKISFHPRVKVHSAPDFDRRTDQLLVEGGKTERDARQPFVTPAGALVAKLELNHFKKEMIVHSKARHCTLFYLDELLE